MGCDLIVGVLMGKKGLKPDWNKARKALASTPDEDLVLEILQTVHGEDDLGMAEECGVTPTDARERVSKALASVEGGWNHQLRAMSSFTCHDRVLLIAGGMSWGDEVPECEDVFLVDNLGLAKAAGFMDSSSPTAKKRSKA